MVLGQKAHAVNFDSTGAFVFVPCLGSDSIAQLVFDAQNGVLEWNPVSPAALLPAASGPRHMVFLSTHKLLAFVLCELSSIIVPFALNASGVLVQVGSPVSTIRAGLPKPLVQAAAEILASADGLFLYASNRASPFGTGDNSIAVLQLTQQGVLTGNVTQHETGENEGVLMFPRHIALSSSVKQPFLFAVSQNSSMITVFARNPAAGTLSQVSAVRAEMAHPTFIGELLLAT